ncbi:hypothetical protein [Caballeronia sp. ATUFL_M2_KS44]|uniref:hypothetical protein n=1 Tax=Caballeronia sp. ATUFL_M2_KS44 TaxID=2921767 RepID=UPI0020291476|nr:hypothetical protein [Caballeronia sp. ATUFL_M2_KS44]
MQKEEQLSTAPLGGIQLEAVPDQLEADMEETGPVDARLKDRLEAQPLRAGAVHWKSLWRPQRCGAA